MIVWLASYPRSGNTLLRTILNTTLQVKSYADGERQLYRALTPAERVKDKYEHLPVQRPEAAEMIGHLDLPPDEEAFFAEAAASNTLHCIKTHGFPRDDNPAIYVVRDGRSCMSSYYEYFKKYFPERKISLLHILLGAVQERDWSRHFSAWVDRLGAKVLLLRFEEIVDCSADLLEIIRNFLCHQGPVREWRNPFPELHRSKPGIYRKGKKEWEQEPYWTNEIDELFAFLHGSLMQRLGYVEPREVEAALDGLGRRSGLLGSMVRLLISVLDEKDSFHRICVERQEVIDNLDRVCRERLEIINRLAGMR